MSTELRRGFKRIGTNYLRLGSTLVLGIIEVPLLFYWLGNEGFGLVALLGPTVGFAAVVTEIVNTSLIRELGSAYHTGDPANFRNTYHATVRIAAIATAIAGAITALLVVLLPFLNIDASLLGAAQVFTVAGGLYAMFRIALAPTLSMIVIREHFATQNILLVLYRVLFLLAAVVLFLVLGRDRVSTSIAFYGVGAFGTNILLLVVAAAMMWGRSPELRPSMSKAYHADASNIVSSFGWNTAVIVAISLAERAPQLIINIFFGTSMNAIYGVAYRLGAYARMVTLGLTDGLESVTTRLSAEEDRQHRIQRFLKTSTRLQATIALPAAVTLAVLAEPLLSHWIARAIENPATTIPQAVPVAQLFVVGMVIRGIGEGWVRILYGDGHVRVYAPVLISAALLLPVAVLLAAKYAPTDYSLTLPAMAFSVIWLTGYGLFVPIVGRRAIGASFADFYTPAIRPVLLAGFAAAFLFLCNHLFAPYSLVGVILTILATMSATGTLAFAVVLSPQERGRFVGGLRRGQVGPSTPHSE